MGSLLIVTGPPGAGKSTVAAELAKLDSPSVLVDGDRFFGFLANGAIEPWLPAAHDQNEVVTNAAAAAAGRFAASYATVYDGVIGPWFLSAFAQASGVTHFDYAMLLPPEAVCVRRVRERVGHEFADEAATRTMWTAFREAAIDERHVIAGTATDVAATVHIVRTARARGQLRYDDSLVSRGDQE